MKVFGRNQLFGDLLAGQLFEKYGDQLEEVVIDGRSVDLERAKATLATNRRASESRVQDGVFKVLDWWGDKLESGVRRFESREPKTRLGGWAKRVAERALENTIRHDAESVRQDVRATVKLKGREAFEVSQSVLDVQASRTLQTAALVVEVVALGLGLSAPVVPLNAAATGPFAALLWGMSKGAVVVGASDLARALAHLAYKQLLLTGLGSIPFCVGDGILAASILDDAGDLGRLSKQGVPVNVMNNLADYLPAENETASPST